MVIELNNIQHQYRQTIFHLDVCPVQYFIYCQLKSQMENFFVPKLRVIEQDILFSQGRS